MFKLFYRTNPAPKGIFRENFPHMDQPLTQKQGYRIRWVSHELRSGSSVPNRGTIAYPVRSESRIAAQYRRSGTLIAGVPVWIGNATATKWERRTSVDRRTSIASSSATNCDEEEVEYQEEDTVGDEDVSRVQEEDTVGDEKVSHIA
ncbi:hypothetical protein LXL04_037852 [Taraxacum kok-saghyz]